MTSRTSRLRSLRRKDAYYEQLLQDTELPTSPTAAAGGASGGGGAAGGGSRGSAFGFGALNSATSAASAASAAAVAAAALARHQYPPGSIQALKLLDEEKQQVEAANRTARALASLHAHLNATTTSTSNSSSNNNTLALVHTPPLPLADSHRLSGLLEECVERLELLGVIMAENLKKKKEHGAHNSGKDVFALMNHQATLESLFSSLHLHRSQLSGLSNKSKLLQTLSSLQTLSGLLHTSTLTLSSSLLPPPDARKNGNKRERERRLLVDVLGAGFHELRSGRTYADMLTMIRTEEEEEKRIKESKERSEKTSMIIAKLDREVREEEEEFEETEEEKKDEIREMSERVKHVKKVKSLTMQWEQQNEMARAETLARLRQNRLDELRAAILKTKQAIKQNSLVSSVTSSYLLQSRAQVDATIQSWEAKYEEQYGAKKIMYEEVRERREEEQERLIKLQARWRDESRRKVERILEDRERRMQEEAEAYLEETRQRAARVIQFYWRVYWRRRRVELLKMKKKYMAKLRKEKKEAAANA